eukprot:TRINITY_DN8392_c0_g1_i1.p1 TRINITY_DN8392_c0_g1~~TRINITY_DN8392_c0_g1_i1.p1  ORF type:complete len:381 (-),score=101.83 TRINITY_DN8392_c0_g1_i1:208-1350(-)
MITKARPLLKRLHKNEWSKAQDEFLESLHKPLDWNAVAERANSLFPDFLKTPEEYSKRWESLVKGAETKEPWSIREEVRMLIAHSKYKNKWSEMGAVLKGRTNNTIKNKFYSIFRRVKGKIQKADYTYSSKLELLEICYIVSLIEQYLAVQPLNSKPKGKRGKDFIFSLVHNLTPNAVRNYKEQVQKLASHKCNLDELFNELINDYKVFAVNGQAEAKQKVETMGRKEETKADAEQKPDCKPIFTAKKIEEGKEHTSEEKTLVKPYSSALPEAGYVAKSNYVPCRAETEEPLNHIRVPEQDFSLAFEMDYMSPLFSPLSLSAGPAAAAARAPGAVCFNDEGFGDVSFLAKTMGEEKFRPQMSFIGGRPMFDYGKWMNPGT